MRIILLLFVLSFNAFALRPRCKTSLVLNPTGDSRESLILFSKMKNSTAKTLLPKGELVANLDIYNEDIDYKVKWTRNRCIFQKATLTVNGKKTVYSQKLLGQYLKVVGGTLVTPLSFTVDVLINMATYGWYGDLVWFFDGKLLVQRTSIDPYFTLARLYQNRKRFAKSSYFQSPADCTAEKLREISKLYIECKK